MSLDFKSNPRFRLNCAHWQPGRRPNAALSVERQSQVRASTLTNNETEKAWRYARTHRVSFAEACKQLFEE